MNLSAIITMIVVFLIFIVGLWYCFKKVKRTSEKNYGSYSGDEDEKIE